MCERIYKYFHDDETNLNRRAREELRIRTNLLFPSSSSNAQQQQQLRHELFSLQQFLDEADPFGMTEIRNNNNNSNTRRQNNKSLSSSLLPSEGTSVLTLMDLRYLLLQKYPQLLLTASSSSPSSNNNHHNIQFVANFSKSLVINLLHYLKNLEDNDDEDHHHNDMDNNNIDDE